MMNMSELISWFQIEYPDLVKSMQECSHHGEHLNPYHLEGSVFCHTMMVCLKAQYAPYEVQIAALLHDIGKPSTRAVNPKNERVSFFNHDAVSAFMSLEILKREELKLNDDQIIMIFNIITLHTQIFKQTPEQLGKLFTNKENWANRFTDLGRADSMGRFYSNPGETDTSYFPVDTKDPIEKDLEVIVLCGLPGAGKSTWIAKNCPEALVVSRDNCLMDLAAQKFGAKDFTYSEAWNTVDQKEVDKLLQIRYKETVKYGHVMSKQVVVDMTHMSKKSRRRSLSHFGSKYTKKCVVFLPDLPTLYLQNDNRDGKIIGKDIIARMMRSFSPPMLDEFDEIRYVL